MTRVSSILVGIVALLAACGGGGEKQPEHANAAMTPAAPVVERRDPILAGATAFKDDACACTDKACAAKVEADFDAWPEHPAPLSAPEIDNVVVDYEACIDTFGGAKAVIDRVAEYRDLMCGCKDKACAIRVNDRYTRWGAGVAGRAGRYTDDRSTEDDVKMMTEIAMAYGECMSKTSEPEVKP
jgi:hypothetical protein